MKKILALAGLVASVFMGANANAAPDTAWVTPVFITESVTINGCTPSDSVLVRYGFINHGPYTIKTTDTVAFLDFTNQSSDPSDGVWTYSPAANVAPGDTFALEDFNTFYTGIGTALPINWLVDGSGAVVVPPFASGNYAGVAQWLGVMTQTANGLDFRSDIISNNQDSTSAYADSSIAFIGISLHCTTGIKDAQFSKSTLNVFPNPASGELSFTNDFAAATKAEVIVTDIAGRVVKTMDLGKQNAGTKTFRIDIQDLHKGMYYISLITENTKSINKFIKN
ncbi:T9SS type A sorting domain-containing protein [Taibaiella lutea]|uniref:T9SS type A sorting domain-containing protein n=1 Tax=Taibaiella lutea TaxID=2608001 RepID=A0A5M6CJP1_9BACT|nr:T9SS type A sorting domain-containing protein [Taibaiella lutea]KAA5533329.1 T9SS type A sorting domain-containing protein [Taibaiella lutea]